MKNYLADFFEYFSKSIVIADNKRPQKISRTGKTYQHGIGPHTEDETVDLTLQELPKKWDGLWKRFIPYPNNKRSKCDLSIETEEGKLFIEIKMMRLFGDNGKTSDNITMHILSPYPQQRSALTDIEKLKVSGFDGQKAIVIYGYDYDEYPIVRMMDCFEKLAQDDFDLPRVRFEFEGLVHPIHEKGEIFGWMINDYSK